MKTLKILIQVSERQVLVQIMNIEQLQNEGQNNLLPALATSDKVSKRFVKATQDHIFAMKERRFELKTVINIIWGVKIFKDWLQENEKV